MKRTDRKKPLMGKNQIPVGKKEAETMLEIYHSQEGQVLPISTPTYASWVNLVCPSPEELQRVHEECHIPLEFLQAALDIEEKSRVETEDNVKLVLVDIPITDLDMPEYEAYSTVPLSIIITEQLVVTVCMHDTTILRDIAENKLKNIQIKYKTRFVFTILIRLAGRFVLYLSRIEKTSTKIERQLNESLKNEQLLQLLALSKSLTYFSTSLKASETTLKKMQRGHILTLYEDDFDLLEDALIEFSQAIEMAMSYSTILKATMETYSSVASNNLNDIMKVLAVITIVMAVPEIIFAFYGMNVEQLPYDHFFWFPIGIALFGSLCIWVIIKKAKFYK